MYDKKYGKKTAQHAVVYLAAVLLVSFLSSAVSADDTGLTRGSQFTITVTGTPTTPYYVWLTRTSSMSGEPGDQPPVLIANQVNIVKDPSGGPYVIGSYQFNNGGGLRIIDDVAPSTASMSNTNYYGLVTTNSNGYAVVAFQTSSNTAMRTFSVKVENAQSAAGSDILVQRGNVPVKQGSVTIDTVTPLPVRTSLPTLLPLTVTETPAPVPTTAEVVQSPVTTPTPRAPSGALLCIIASGMMILFTRRKTG